MEAELSINEVFLSFEPAKIIIFIEIRRKMKICLTFAT
jgi:hypothetical protein